ncbi:hypothetical protein AAIH70_25935 [Neorhizobium sp. BT27B]|uniref:hypothetical protein n=1 Tax=Neorhizobium sp. BT27B TaxID=3142625 RepID=UPI003D2744B9
MSAGWGERLDKHFEALRIERTKSGTPVFAFEHGLNSDELAELSDYLHAQLRNRAFFLPDWLLWVVYGAELGYDFDGQDYWTNFENRMPYWRHYYHRRWLREAFKRFHRRYQGFVPLGTWATHFSIIAWPITHAILPRDLQTQLARRLFSLRYGLAERLDEKPAVIGRYISERREGSSRFRNFLQQEEMVGRIAIGLLGGSASSASETIFPPTLDRIVQDLETGQSAKAWLGDARRVVERARIKGVGGYGRWPRAAIDNINLELGTASSERPLSLKPSLALVRAEGNEWLVMAQLPSYRPLAEISGDFERFVKTTRCKIEGADGLRPAGWLLSEGPRRVLTSWPNPNLPLVRFEKRHATIDRLMASDACITPGPTWLFETGTDGRASEVVTKKLHPGKRYIIVSQTPIDVLPFSSTARLQCMNCCAQQVDLPAQIENQEYKIFKAAGLLVTRTISIWPAGLPARRWDGQSRAEWLEGELPTFGIGADHDIQDLCVSVNAGARFNLPDVAAGCSAFFSLPDMHAGVHRLRVDAHVARDDGGFAATTATIEVTIASPSGWTPGTTEFKGMVPTVSPSEPTLDDFFEERLVVTVAGPKGYSFKVSVQLFDAGGTVIASELIMEASLPCDEGVWRRQCSHVLRNWSAPWAILSATSASLLIDSEELGTYNIPLHRDVRPVRFVWHTDGKTTQVRLIDEHQGKRPVKASFHPFTVPCMPSVLSLEALQEGFEPPGPGGMFLLEYAEVKETLAISMPHIVDLSELAPEPDQRCFPGGHDALERTQAHLVRWRSAALAGPLANFRRERVVQRLEQHFFKVLCGERWVEAERVYELSRKSTHDLKMLAMKTEANKSFAVLLSRVLAELRGLDEGASIDRFAEMANRYGVSDIATARAAMAICMNGGTKADTQAFDFARSLGKGGRPILRAARFVCDAEVPMVQQNSSREAS